MPRIPGDDPRLPGITPRLVGNGFRWELGCADAGPVFDNSGSFRRIEPDTMRERELVKFQRPPGECKESRDEGIHTFFEINNSERRVGMGTGHAVDVTRRLGSWRRA
eukprot:1327395-Amorphochlora_amoeboformis.AAC.1